MGTDLKFEFKVNLPPVRHKSRNYHMTKIANEPRLRQYLVLAYQIQEKLDADNTLTSKKIAGWLGMTPPRISQILNLLLLSPSIQKDILLSKDEKVCSLTEYKILSIIKEIGWEKQQALWSAFL